MTDKNIPNDWTSCENYEGFIIAVRNGWYAVFSVSGRRWLENYTSRFDARRAIDAA